MYRCVVFDFDGTLADTENMAVRVAMTLAEKYNFRSITEKEIPLIKNMTAREAIAYMGISRFRLPFIIREAHQILKAEISRAELCRPELKDYLNGLDESGIITGVVTSNARDNVQGFLELHGLKGMQFIRSSTIFGKARHFRKILRKFGLKAGEMLYVGDETRDIHAARRAGVAVAAVTWGFNHGDRLASEHPDYLVERVEELDRISRG